MEKIQVEENFDGTAQAEYKETLLAEIKEWSLEIANNPDIDSGEASNIACDIVYNLERLEKLVLES